MFYEKETIKKFVEFHKSEKSVVSLISTEFENPDELAWGRIIRDKQNRVINIVEQKDAANAQRKIKEVNAGFYCFDDLFLQENIDKVQKSPVTSEYYLTDLVKIAVSQNNKVSAFKIPFKEVGIGINTPEDLKKSEEMFKKLD